MTQKHPVSCPICNTPNTWKSDNLFKPFCSERCKLIDLGEWASELRRVPGDEFKPGEVGNEEDF